jgi:hypothetical protein
MSLSSCFLYPKWRKTSRFVNIYGYYVSYLTLLLWVAISIYELRIVAFYVIYTTKLHALINDDDQLKNNSSSIWTWIPWKFSCKVRKLVKYFNLQIYHSLTFLTIRSIIYLFLSTMNSYKNSRYAQSMPIVLNWPLSSIKKCLPSTYPTVSNIHKFFNNNNRPSIFK